MTRGAIEIEYERRKNSEIQYVVFLDLDKIHDLNDQYASDTSDGYEEVDALIREAFAAVHVRVSDQFWLIASGRYKSGDECVFLIHGDPQPFCERLAGELQARGLSATMAYARPLPDFAQTVKGAAIQVKRAKKANQRGRLCEGDQPR